MEMSYWVRVGDRELQVVLREEDGRTTALVDGTELPVQLEEEVPGNPTLLVDGKPYDLAAVSTVLGYSILLDGIPFDLAVEDRRRLAAVNGAKAANHARAELRAPMPGRVARIDVSEGETVEAGQRLLVLEAMKMENDLPAPRAGRIASLAVRAGQTVEMGQPLVLLAEE